MGEDFFKGKGVRTSRRQGAIDALGNIKTQTWKEMTKAFNSINEVVKSGGFKELVGGTTESLKEQMKTSVTGLFSPIENEINQFTANLLSESGLQGAFNKIGNSLGNLITTVAGPETGLGKAVNFIGSAVANTLDFAAKGWESLISGRNAFQLEFQEVIHATTGGGLMAEGGAGAAILGGPFDDEVLRGLLDDFINNLEEGF